MSRADVSPSFLQETPDGAILLRVRVHPRASKVCVEPAGEGVLPVRLTAPPVDNPATKAVRSGSGWKASTRAGFEKR